MGEVGFDSATPHLTEGIVSSANRTDQNQEVLKICFFPWLLQIRSARCHNGTLVGAVVLRACFVGAAARFSWDHDGRQADIMNFIAWIIFGLLAGMVAKIIMPGEDPGGIFVTILIGVAGAFVGGFLGNIFGFQEVSGFNFPSFVTAVIGSLVLLLGYRLLRSR